jgi:hypothetical protein
MFSIVPSVRKPSKAPKTSAKIDFAADLQAHFGAVQRRLGAIVESVCGGAPKAQTITDRFGVYRKLGWQVWQVVYSNEGLAALQHLPNPASLKVWNDAAVRAGVGADLIQRLDESIESFHRCAQLHAEDRTMLDMLVDSQDATRDLDVEAKWRKQMFLGNAYVWGARAKCMRATALIYPSRSRKDYFDMVRLQSLIGLVRNRPGIRWPLAQLLIRDSEGRKLSFGRVPLSMSPAVKETGVPLLEEFCSKPLPAVQRRPGPMGMVEDELLPGPVGQAGATDVVMGERLEAVAPAWADKPGETSSFGTGVRTPCEVFISDQLVHKELYPGAQRELCVFGELITPLSRDERDRIPVADRVQHLGRASDGIATGEFPKYGDMIELAIRATGYTPEDFDVYRVRMRYPPLPVSVILRQPWAMKPPDASSPQVKDSTP